MRRRACASSSRTTCVLVAESAIKTRDDVRALEDIGVDAMLVGEAIVTASDPEAKIRELLGSQ